IAGPRMGLALQDVADPLAGSDGLLEVDSGLDAESVQQGEAVVGRAVAGGALGMRTAAESRDARIEGRDAELEARVDIGSRHTVGIVEMARDVVNVVDPQGRLDRSLRPIRGPDANRVRAADRLHTHFAPNP